MLDLTGLVRVDILGQVLDAGITAIKHDLDRCAIVTIDPYESEPWLQVSRDEIGFHWLHLHSGHLRVAISVEITDPPSTGLFERSCVAAQEELT